MALNDLFELILQTEVGSSTLQNRFYYLGATAPTDAAGLVDAFIADMAPEWADCIQSLATLTQIAVRNLDNLSDIDTRTISVSGTRSGEVLRNFYGVAMELDPVSPLVRVGRKFISPISESDVSAGSISVGYEAVLDTLELALIGLISDGAGKDYDHVMFSPATLTRPFDVITSVGGAIFKRISTQNSRKNF